MHGKRFAYSLAAHSHTGHQRGEHKTYQLLWRAFKVRQNLGGDDGSGCTGNNAADIADHIITDRAHFIRISQQTDTFRRARYLLCSHRMKGLLFCRSYSHTNNIKNNTQKNNEQQNQECRYDSGHRQKTG